MQKHAHCFNKKAIPNTKYSFKVRLKKWLSATSLTMSSALLYQRPFMILVFSSILLCHPVSRLCSTDYDNCTKQHFRSFGQLHLDLKSFQNAAAQFTGTLRLFRLHALQLNAFWENKLLTCKKQTANQLAGMANWFAVCSACCSTSLFKF